MTTLSSWRDVFRDLSLLDRHRAARTFGRPILKFVLGPAAMLAGGLADPLAAKLPLLGGGFVLVEGGQWAGVRALQREDAQHALTLLLRHTVDVLEASRPSPAERTLRANIMLPGEGGRLTIAYATTGYPVEEARLAWARGQGCAGMAWETGRTQHAPEDAELPVSVDDAGRRSRPWNMTNEQIRMTAGSVASVLSVPIRGRRDRTVGVFTLDDSKAIAESSLGNADIRSAAEEVAVTMSDLLERAHPTRPD